MKKFAIAALLMTCALEATNGYARIGYGAKSLGMGGVGFALPQDTFVIAMNPAGLSCVGSRIDAEVDWIWNRTRVNSSDTTTILPLRADNWLTFPNLGVSWAVNNCHTLGIAGYAFGGLRFSNKMSASPDAPQMEGLNYRFWAYMLSPAWAWQINSMHTLGIAINIAYANLAIERISPTDFPSQDKRWGPGFRIGWLGRLCDCLWAGVSYQSPTWIEKFTRYEEILNHGGDLTLPSRWGFGVTFVPLCRLILSLDGEIIRWTDADSVKAGSQIPQSFSDPGAFAWNWQDQAVMKFGVAYELPCDLTVRIGYAWATSLVPACDPFIGSVTVGNVQRKHLTIGATYEVGCFEVSGYYMRGFTHGTSLNVFEQGTSMNLRLISEQNNFGIAIAQRF